MPMDVVLPLEVIEYDFGGFGLGFWIGHIDEMEENSAKSRALISELLEVLARKDRPMLKLPPPTVDEVTVEAPLDWNGNRFSLCINTFDGVVALAHQERAPLLELLEFVRDSVRVI